jgi:hypothetical protein
MNGCRWFIYLAWSCSAIASVAGCAALKTPESQLFARGSRYESASITYRVGPRASRGGSQDVVLASHQQASSAPIASAGQQNAMLAIRYPHPAGRDGYARVELVVKGGQKSAALPPTRLPAWLDRARRFAHESLPGVSLGDGVEEALGLDLPVADLDRLVERVQRPVQSAGGAAPLVGASVAVKINGAPLPTLNAHVAELAALIARVRKEGGLISYTTLGDDLEVPQAEAPFASVPSRVVTASYTTPAITRLPPVESTMP